MSQLVGIGKKKETELNNANIDTVGKLYEEHEQQMTVPNATINPSVDALIRKTVTDGRNKRKGKHPPRSVFFNHQGEKNPFKSLYGNDWEKEVMKYGELKGRMSIRTVTKWMVDTASSWFPNDKDKPVGERFVIWHDALSMFVSSANRTWMQEQHAPDGRTYYDCFVFPQRGLNGGIKGYEHRPVGNSPEFMPWDASLFMDFNFALWRHEAITANLDKDDPRKFSSATPATLDYAARRLLDPDEHVKGRSGITSKRIIQDVNGALNAHFDVVANDGTAGDGIGKRTGERAKRIAKKGETRGGPRKRGQGIAYAGELAFHVQLDDLIEEENRKWHELLCSKPEVKPKRRDSI